MRANEATKKRVRVHWGWTAPPTLPMGPTDVCIYRLCSHMYAGCVRTSTNSTSSLFFSRSRYSAISMSSYTCNTANCHLRACIPSTQHCFGRLRFLFGFQHCREGVRALSGAGMGLPETPEPIATHNDLCFSSWRGHMPPVTSSYSQQSSHRRVSSRSRSRACLSTSWRL